MDITYSKHGDYFLPDLLVPEEKTYSLGRYGRLRFEYIKHHRQVLYFKLKTTCKLNEHLADVDMQAKQMVELITSQMARAEGITETLKESDQMAWVGAMNNIKSCAEEIVCQELIYA